jgi:hypothetical protein
VTDEFHHVSNLESLSLFKRAEAELELREKSKDKLKQENSACLDIDELFPQSAGKCKHESAKHGEGKPVRGLKAECKRLSSCSAISCALSDWFDVVISLRAGNRCQDPKALTLA